jgi:hypothetical protein
MHFRITLQFISSVAMAIAVSSCSALPVDELAPDPIVLIRPEGSEVYQLSSRYLREDGEVAKLVTVEFGLDTSAGAPEVVTVREANYSEGTDATQPFELSPETRARWGGDETCLGRFQLPEQFEINDLAPPAVPDELFGAVTDFVSFLVIQSRGFGAHRLRRVGDKSPLPNHKIRWQRLPETIDARIDDHGGSLQLVSRTETAAVLHYLPEPWDVGVLRRAGDMRIFLGGSETFHLESSIDPRTGLLMAGRSLQNWADFSLWVPFEGEEAPLRADWPTGPARAIPFRRELELVRQTQL